MLVSINDKKKKCRLVYHEHIVCHPLKSFVFFKVNETQICVDIPAVRNFKVSNTQDALVSITDYYEPSKCVLEFLIS